jgi:hypothetical protein
MKDVVPAPLEPNALGTILSVNPPLEAIDEGCLMDLHLHASDWEKTLSNCCHWHRYCGVEIRAAKKDFRPPESIKIQ